MKRENRLGACPACGRRRPGRPRAEVPVQNVSDSLAKGMTVAVVARRYGISRASVYRVRNASVIQLTS
ncbi:MAG: helix-turn-helix domain-containing protein [Chloroflexi bacterium]|nr:helix-turn-helix domain-containing protein [Chloroflexota bacterium]